MLVPGIVGPIIAGGLIGDLGGGIDPVQQPSVVV
jgi:hypothetical protein